MFFQKGEFKIVAQYDSSTRGLQYITKVFNSSILGRIVAEMFSSPQIFCNATWFLHGLRVGRTVKAFYMLNYKCRSHHRSSLNSSLPIEQTSFYGFRGRNESAHKGPQSGAQRAHTRVRSQEPRAGALKHPISPLPLS